MSTSMSDPLIIAVPAKGRLQENAEEFFARAGMKLVKPRGARDYRGAVAGMSGVEVAYLSASEIADALAHGSIHLGVTGEDLLREIDPRHGQARGDHRGARLRLCQCGRRRAAGLDRRAQHGRSRRRGDRVPLEARSQDAGRDQVHQSHPRFLLASRHRRLSHRRKLRRDRRRAGRGLRRADRRHHHHRHDACGQRPQDRRGRHDPEVAGQSRGLAQRDLGRGRARNRAPHSRPRRGASAGARLSRGAHALPRLQRCDAGGGAKTVSAWCRRSAGRPRRAC